MIDEETSPDPLQQLQLIDSMINKAKNRFSENGYMYLVWGWTILFCAICSYLLGNVLQLRQAYLVWLLPWLTMIYQFVYISKQKKPRPVVTYTDEIIKYIWLVFIVLIMLLLAIMFRYKAYQQINPVILVLYGMPTFLIGKILKFKPLIVGALSCWLLACFSMFVPAQFHILFIAGAVIMAWIIPGYLLKQRYNKQ